MPSSGSYFSYFRDAGWDAWVQEEINHVRVHPQVPSQAWRKRALHMPSSQCWTQSGEGGELGGLEAGSYRVDGNDIYSDDTSRDFQIGAP